MDPSAEQTPVLPFELPDSVSGQESVVYEYMLDLTKGTEITPESWEEAEELAISCVERRLRGYYSLGRLATNPDSLYYRLVHARG